LLFGEGEVHGGLWLRAGRGGGAILPDRCAAIKPAGERSRRERRFPMGHILFGAPGLASHQLHGRLARALMDRGHRITVLAADRASFELHSQQGLAALLLGRGRVPRTHVPVAEFAAIDAALRGRRQARRRDAAALARRVAPLRDLLERDPPDLLLVHQGRSGLHRLLHYVARESGCRILHTGAGLLPGTMQWDEAGIDGDAAACRRTTDDYRTGERDRAFLAATLSAWLGDLRAALPRVAVPPELRTRWWRRRTPALDAAACAELCAPPPATPLVAVLLQDDDDPRVRLDAGTVPSPAELALAAARAAQRIDASLGAVVVLPPRGLAADSLARLARAGLPLRAARAAPGLLSAAVAAVTVNHPLGIGALLAGTPVLHLGRTPYGVEGVSVRGSAATLEADLRRALALADEALRECFLTRYLRYDHVWCAPESPDGNGLRGLVLGIERRLRESAPFPRPATYRAGPVWPLSY
jgi:hypothetical protein